MKQIYFIGWMMWCIASCGPCKKGSNNVIEQIRTVPAFTNIVSEVDFTVHITQAPVQEIKAISDDNVLDFLDIYVLKNTLYIVMKDGQCFKKVNRKDIYISAPIIKGIKLAASGDIYTNNQIKGDSINAELTGSGNMYISDSCGYAKVYSTGTGKIEMKGICDQQLIELRYQGSIDNSMFRSNETYAIGAGFGHMYLWVLNNLQATTSAQGNIYYKGNPTVSKNEIGVGSVIPIN
jgi:hypothetical protein